jgi:hypothetical protein
MGQHVFLIYTASYAVETADVAPENTHLQQTWCHKLDLSLRRILNFQRKQPLIKSINFLQL